MDRLFEDAMAPYQRSQAGVFPLINLTEDKNNFYVRAELPGVKSDDLDIMATGKKISISGQRTIHSEKDNARYHRREREAGNFSRVLNMPSDINADGIEAKLENGILTVMIPKAETAKPRQIRIN